MNEKKGGLQYATVESFVNCGLRVNGGVEANVLSKLSEGTHSKHKKKDARGWYNSINFFQIVTPFLFFYFFLKTTLF